jgi:hypothetical protein
MDARGAIGVGVCSGPVLVVAGTGSTQDSADCFTPKAARFSEMKS